MRRTDGKAAYRRTVFCHACLCEQSHRSGNGSVFCQRKHLRQYRTDPLSSLWQIPLCLFLARRSGVFLPVVLNAILGIFLPIVSGNTSVWYFVPYCYAAKLAEPLMGIQLNGTFADSSSFSTTAFLSIGLSFLLFAVLTYADARDFSKRRETI